MGLSIVGAVHPRFRVPHHAAVAVAVVVCGMVGIGDLSGVIGFSSFGRAGLGSV